MRNKSFDCVEMKNEIQQELALEYKGLTDEERWSRLNEILASSNHPVARKWKEIRPTTTPITERS